MYTELLSPIFGTHNGLPVIAVGAVVFGDPFYVIVDDEGKMRHIPITDFVMDIRYSEGEWHDTSPDIHVPQDDD